MLLIYLRKNLRLVLAGSAIAQGRLELAGELGGPGTSFRNTRNVLGNKNLKNWHLWRFQDEHGSPIAELINCSGISWDSGGHVLGSLFSCMKHDRTDRTLLER